VMDQVEREKGYGVISAPRRVVPLLSEQIAMGSNMDWELSSTRHSSICTMLSSNDAVGAPSIESTRTSIEVATVISLFSCPDAMKEDIRFSDAGYA
jgi:hypothetical protein